MSDRKRVLIVDDEADVRLFLQDFLSERDWAVTTAENGEKALEEIRRNKPDVVLLDIMMPGMDGLQCLEKIKELDPKITVIMITAFKDETRIARAKGLGAANYIVKPFSLSYLETELGKVLGPSS